MQKAWLDADMTETAKADVVYQASDWESDTRTLPVTDGDDKVWEETVEHLPGQGKESFTEEGNTVEKVVYYSYYVVEQASDYNVETKQETPNGTGDDAGKFVFINQVTEIEITKIWYDAKNQPTQWKNGEDFDLTFTLKRDSGGVEQTATVTINAKDDGKVTLESTTEFDTSKIKATLTKLASYDQGYKIKLTNLPVSTTVTVDDQGTSTTMTYNWTYKMVENVPERYTASYQQSDGATKSDGEAYALNGETVINIPITYELPSTGGSGTTFFYVLGSVLTLLAAVLLITKRRTECQQRD